MDTYIVLTHGWNSISIASFTEEEEAKEYAKTNEGIITKLISSKKEFDMFLE